MKVSSAEGRRRIENLNVGWHTFQGVWEFKYLFVSINNENKISNEISNRIISGNSFLCPPENFQTQFSPVSYTHLIRHTVAQVFKIANLFQDSTIYNNFCPYGISSTKSHHVGFCLLYTSRCV